MIRENVRENALGALLGQCVGDALGCRYHFRNASDVCQQIDADRDADFLPIRGSAVFDFPPGQVGDGTEFCMLLVRSFCRRLAVSVPDVVEAILRWKRSDPIGTHNPIFEALEVDIENEDPCTKNSAQMEKRITLNALRKNKASLSNICLSAAMPIAVISVTSENPSQHVSNLATRITRLTQPHPAAVDAVRVLSTAIRSLVLSPDVQAAYDNAMKAARTPLVREHLTQARYRPHPQPENETVLDDSELPVDFIGITLQVAFYYMRTARSFSEGVIAAIQHGGDTTTNASITGVLLGARFGVNGIPMAWRNTVVKARLERQNVFPDVQLNDLNELVHRLIHKVSI